MTVRDLIKELRDLPQDLPVVTDYKEITDIAVEDNFYFLDKHNKNGYDISSAVVLE